jgi:hypothetical protein
MEYERALVDNVTVILSGDTLPHCMESTSRQGQVDDTQR